MVDSKLTVVAIRAALKAGNLLKHGFGTSYRVSRKPGIHNLVTEYDEAAEKTIISTIREEFPDHAFLAEESGLSRGQSASVVWIIDPLDGTANFAHNIPLFAVSIAAVIGSEVQVGVIYQPMTDELFVAERGQGAYCNGAKLKVTENRVLQDAFGATGLTYHENLAPEYMKRFAHIAQLGNPLRDLGTAAMHLAYVATGSFDLFWIESLYPWDVAAGKLLVEEAGGRVTHYNGAPIVNLSEPSSVVATNGKLHETLLKQLRNMQ